jgi:CheY-like chemotaxis protein
MNLRCTESTISNDRNHTGVNMSRRVLIADDDDAIVELLVQFLTDEGYEVLTAANGAEAVRQAREAHPDCILMDLNMPILNGEAAIRELKGDPETEDIRIYAMSAGWRIRVRNEDLQADGSIMKPFNLVTILYAVNDQLHPTND